jgi:hypothetical protein
MAALILAAAEAQGAAITENLGYALFRRSPSRRTMYSS